jgi:methyl acetate hydrolase
MEGMRAAGSQFRGGVRNTHFWFDPTNDVAGILMTQLLPFLDDEFMFLYADFERAVYANLDQLKAPIRP